MATVRQSLAIGTTALACATVLTSCTQSEPTPGTPAAPTGPGASTGAAAVAAPAITRERAGQIATDRYGGRVLDVEPDTATGVPTWEVEVADSKQGRIEVDVTQTDGTIVELEQDS